MKKIILVAAILISGASMAQEITKSDILKTVEHIQQLAHEQKTELSKAQSDYQLQGKQLQAKTEEAQKWHSEASENARERDVILYLFAILFGFYIGTLFGGEVMRDFPAPWSFIACAAVYIGSGIAAYTLGRIVLASLAHFIPHL